MNEENKKTGGVQDSKKAELKASKKVFNWEEEMKTWQTNIKFTNHPNVDMDDHKFLFLLAHSFSLAPEEKTNIIKHMPELSQSQVNQLFTIFTDEQTQFIELEAQYPEHVAKERTKHLKAWDSVVMNYEQEGQSVEDTAKADEIKKNLGI